MGKLGAVLLSMLIFFFYSFFLIGSNGGYLSMIKAFLVVAGIGLLVLFILRYLVKVEGTAELSGVSEGAATRLVHQAIWGNTDSLVGWPSGSFEFTQENDRDPGVLVATEWLPTGAGAALRQFILVPLRIGVLITSVFSVFGCIGFLVSAMCVLVVYGVFLFFFVVPLILGWLIEVIFKKPLRGRIEIRFAPTDVGTKIQLKFSGISAILMKKKVMTAFNPPVLPGRYASLVAAARRESH